MVLRAPRIRARSRFEFQFDVEHEGFKYCHRCKVTEAIPNKRLAYTWRYEGYAGDSLVTFELFAQGRNEAHADARGP